MALVLYHVEDAAKEKQLSALCRELHLTARRLTNADRDRAVAALCGEKVNANVQKAPAGYKLPEVLIFSGFAGEMLDVFLAAYKKSGYRAHSAESRTHGVQQQVEPLHTVRGAAPRARRHAATWELWKVRLLII